MKKFLIFIVILLAAIGVCLYLATDAANAFIKEKVAEVGSKVTEQTVAVNNVDMRFLSGGGTISGLSLSNPKKYNAPAAFSLNELTLDVNLKSLITDVIVVDEIIIDKPETVVEFNKNGGANFKDLLDTIKKNSASTTQQPKQEDHSDKKDPIVRIDRLVISGVLLTVDLTKLGNKSHQMTLPDIVLSNVGGEAGMPASQLGGEVLKQTLSSIWKQAKEQQIKILKGQVTEKVKEKAKEKLGGLLDKFKG